MSVKSAFHERLPKEIDIQCADSLRQILAATNQSNGTTKIGITIDKEQSADVVLTHGVAKTFLDVLRLISSGRGFQMVPYGVELTTQQAADLLNVSRPYLIKILDEKQIAHTLIGRHRRIKAVDLFAYKKKRDAERERLLTKMARIDAKYLLDT